MERQELSATSESIDGTVMVEYSNLYETMFEDANYGIGVHDAETGRLESANDVYVELVGRDRDSITEMELAEIVAPVSFLDEPDISASVTAATAGEPQQRHCVPTAGGDGGQLELSLESITSDSEQLLIVRLRELGALGSGLERLAVQITGTGVWRWDIQSGEVVWNDQLERILGLEPGVQEETIEALRDRMVAADRESHLEQIEAAIEAGEPVVTEFRMEHADGHTIWAELRGHPITTRSGMQLIGTMSDVTEKKRREHEINELSTHLDIALGGASPAVWEWDMETDDVVVNERVEELIGLEFGEFSGTFESFVERVHPEDVPTVNEAIQRAIAHDELYETEFRLEHEDGSYIWVASRGRLDDTSTDRMIGVLTNVTDRKHYERELAESNEALEQLTDQLEFFTSILRHDVLNGMTVIKMRAELLADQLDGQQAQYAETILEWAETTTDVTGRVRDVIETLTAEDRERRFDPIPLSELLERKVETLQNAYPESEWTSHIEPGVVVGADDLLGDAIGNVLSNTIEHNDTDGLTVDVELEANGDFARLMIADDGQGIDDDRKNAVFRRGETSHAKETGSGFGLFYVDVMIDNYGGNIWVEDGEDGGARFVAELPLAETGGER